MKISIPEGKYCISCPFRDFSLIDDCPNFECHVFQRSWSKNDELKINECLKEFGEGGELELIREEDSLKNLIKKHIKLYSKMLDERDDYFVSGKLMEDEELLKEA